MSLVSAAGGAMSERRRIVFENQSDVLVVAVYFYRKHDLMLLNLSLISYLPGR
jgi:hypothetical protein